MRPRAVAPLVFLVTLLTGACIDETELAVTGEELYRRHCASCHGVGGRGDGPLAASLRRPPSDLRTIAQRSGGQFQESGVMMVIDGRREVAEHGPRDMPVWGAVFAEKLVGKPFGVYEGIVYTRALADYLRSIQEPGPDDRELEPRP
jgi:mono/diheme cytochrome c family protein